MAANRALACVDDLGPLRRPTSASTAGGSAATSSWAASHTACACRPKVGIGEPVGRRLPSGSEGQVEHVAPHRHHRHDDDDQRAPGPAATGAAGRRGGGGHRRSLASGGRTLSNPGQPSGVLPCPG